MHNSGLIFKDPQEAKQILILENNSCGNIIKVELLDEEGTGTLYMKTCRKFFLSV